MTHEWEGYPKAVNRLCKYVLRQWTETLVCCSGGDDIEPDPTHSPEEIQRWFLDAMAGKDVGTYGILQPTGDIWADSQGRIIERIAGSPWMGRDWILKSYGGNGPISEDYWHYFEDEALQRAAQMQGVFWQRPDIIQQHNHWTRDRRAGPQRPAFLLKAQQMWESDQKAFARHLANGFKESLPA